MFHIGRAPPSQRRRRIGRPHVQASSVKSVATKFTGLPKSWLILPKSELSYFQRQLDTPNTDSFIEPYLSSICFSVKFPRNSIAYNMAKGAFPITVQYDDIAQSIKQVYTKNMQIRWAMKKLMNIWKIKHTRMMNDEDIATQEVPKKPVIFVDWKTKTSHQFEASTILRDSVNRLINHDQLIIHPQEPRNPFTNAHLGYGGLISLHKQLRKAGLTHWLWEAFAASNFCIKTLEMAYEVPMKLYCLDIMIADSKNYNTLELVMEFIIDEYSHHLIYNPPRESLVLKIVTSKWDTPKMQEWVKLCRTFWTNEIRGRSEDNMLVHDKSELLIRVANRWFLS
jgi:hypothetical protein